ncbi:MAG TPA: hypothetical protein VFW98_16825 [Gemmatimonadaceae bacterium]|nr:hypothetical protein [Gemmatimonadaceae bacterium]
MLQRFPWRALCVALCALPLACNTTSAPVAQSTVAGVYTLQSIANLPLPAPATGAEFAGPLGDSVVVLNGRLVLGDSARASSEVSYVYANSPGQQHSVQLLGSYWAVSGDTLRIANDPAGTSNAVFGNLGLGAVQLFIHDVPWVFVR